MNIDILEKNLYNDDRKRDDKRTKRFVQKGGLNERRKTIKT